MEYQKFCYIKDCNPGDIVILTTFSYLTIGKVIRKTKGNSKGNSSVVVHLLNKDYFRITSEDLNNPVFRKLKYVYPYTTVYVIRNEELL